MRRYVRMAGLPHILQTAVRDTALSAYAIARMVVSKGSLRKSRFRPAAITTLWLANASRTSARSGEELDLVYGDHVVLTPTSSGGTT
jgi:hypothetical protein